MPTHFDATLSKDIHKDISQIKRLPVKVDEHTDQLVEQSRSPHEIMPKTISFNKESQAKEQFVRKVEAGEGTVVDKTLHKYVVLYVDILTFYSSSYLKYSFYIVIAMEDTDHVTVGQQHAGVVDNRSPGDHLVDEDLHYVLDRVHGRHVDHDLGVLLVVRRVKQVDVLSAK